MSRKRARIAVLLAAAIVACSSDEKNSGDATPSGADGGVTPKGPGGADGGGSSTNDGRGSPTKDGGACEDASCAGSDGGPTSGGVELAGPSAALFASHPYYTCVTNRFVATAANGGSDDNDGTAATTGGGHGPWLTLQHAAQAIPKPAPGYCVNIGDGTYTITSSINADHGGTEASMTGLTVFRATNLLGVKLVAAGSTFNIVNASVPYLVFDGLELDGVHRTEDSAGINTCLGGTSYNGIHHVFVMNSFIHDMGGNGIAACWGEYYWFLHNRLDGNAYESWNSGASIYEPIVIPGYTPTAYDNRWTPYHNVVAFNRCFGNFTRPEGGPHTDGNGLIYDDTQHEQSSPNVVYEPKALIMGNVTWDNGGFGIQVGPTSANADVFNNTAYNNGLDTLNTGTWRGELSSATAKNVTFRNNIGFAIVGAGIRENNAPFRGNHTSTPATVTNLWENNIAFGAEPAMDAPNTFPTPSNKVGTDPKLVSVSTGNFALQPGSPAIGSGAVVPYWPQQNVGAIDIGACPHDATTCP